MVNTSYLSMTEHLVIYMLEIHKHRVKAERALFEFLTSLKYYGERWLRARMYSIMCGLVKNGDVTQPEKPSDKCADVFAIEFYFHAYNLAQEKKTEWLESKEGFTYIPKPVEDKISQKMMSIVPPSEIGRWNKSITVELRKMKADPEEKFESDFIDLDKLFHMYME